jgi:hypothetical protein
MIFYSQSHIRVPIQKYICVFIKQKLSVEWYAGLFSVTDSKTRVWKMQTFLHGRVVKAIYVRNWFYWLQ